MYDNGSLKPKPKAPKLSKKAQIEAKPKQNRLLSVISDPPTVKNEFQINTIAYGDQINPRGAVLSNGNIIAVWQDAAGEDGSKSGVFFQIVSSIGEKINTQVQANTYYQDHQKMPEIIALPKSDGGFLIVWVTTKQGNDPDEGIRGQFFYANGQTRLSEFHINTYTYNNQTEPTLSLSYKQDRIIVAWNSIGQDGDKGGIYYQILDFSGNKLLASEMQVDSNPLGNQITPKIVPMEDDGYVILWINVDQQAIYQQRYTSSNKTNGYKFKINTSFGVIYS